MLQDSRSAAINSSDSYADGEKLGVLLHWVFEVFNK